MPDLAAYAPSPSIIAARRAVLIPDPTPAIQSLWDGLQSALASYDLAVVSSLSSEGVSRSMNFDAARVNVEEWLTAYQEAVAEAAATLPADADPVLTRQAMGFHVSHSTVALRC